MRLSRLLLAIAVILVACSTDPPPAGPSPPPAATADPCASCPEGAACEGGVCDEGHWSKSAFLDLFVEGFTVVEAQCSDPAGSPDPAIVVVVNDMGTAGGQCPDSYGCTFSPPLLVPSVPWGTLVSLIVKDIDLSEHDPCWTGTLPVPHTRNLARITSAVAGGGSITYRWAPSP